MTLIQTIAKPIASPRSVAEAHKLPDNLVALYEIFFNDGQAFGIGRLDEIDAMVSQGVVTKEERDSFILVKVAEE